jgi:hypothetical protein
MPTQSGLSWQTLQLPFRAGLNQRADDRARLQPFLDICKDVQFDELGGLQERFPYAAMSNSINGGGTLSNCRRLAVANDELLCFTSEALYSWNAQLSQWVLRATHLAVEVTETQRFAAPGDQFTADRCELNGAVVYAWTQGGVVWWAQIDKTTGSVLQPPTSLIAASTRPRLVALDTAVLLLLESAGNLVLLSIDPANPGATLPATTVAAAAVFNLYYDIVKVNGQDLAVGAYRRDTTTSYSVFTIPAVGAITTVTKARVCDGPIAVASTPSTGLQVQVVRGNGTNVQGDLLTTSTLADVFTGQAIGTAATSLQQVTVEFSTVLVGGFGVATAFWSRAEATTGSDGTIKKNTVTTNNVVGTESTLLLKQGLASRAFPAEGRVFVWAVFARLNEVTGLSGAVSTGVRAQLQNTYFLYRDDGFLTARAAMDVAGGHSPVTGHLPGVAPTSLTGLDFAWCGARRRIIDIGGSVGGRSSFDARSPLDVTFSFDSNVSRRTTPLGRTLYVADSIPLQYDGQGLYEVGFLIYPYAMFLTTGGAGAIPAGTYAYKATYKWLSGVGETERSTCGFGARITAPGANNHAINLAALNITKKSASRIAPTVEIWRTAINGAVFFLDSGLDPAQLASAGVQNGYIPNDAAAFNVPSTGVFVMQDNYTDAILTVQETDPETEETLEVLAPPGAKMLVATDARLILGGVAGDPDRIWYSRLRDAEQVASFHDTLTADVSRPGGAIAAIAINGETITVFRASSIYALPGDGKSNVGAGTNPGPPRVISLDVGAVSQESVAFTPLGTVFKSSKGWYLLTLGWELKYIGGAVSDYDSETVHSITVIERQHQVRILTSARMLVWDYLAVTEESPIGQWGEWTISDGVHALMWRGQHVYLTATGPALQGTTYTALTYGHDIETCFIKPADLQGAVSIRRLQILGEYRSAVLMRVRVAYDYNTAYVDDMVWAPTPTTVGGPLMVSHPIERPKSTSVKIRITAVVAGVLATRATATLATPVQTSGTNWAATFRAVALGELGNAYTLSVAFLAGTSAIDVRDHFAYDLSEGRWRPSTGTIGVLITGAPTVAQVEAAIAAGTALITLLTPDATPSKTIATAPMVIIGTTSGAFSGGTFTAPTTEAYKLTGLGLEVGIERGSLVPLPKIQQV